MKVFSQLEVAQCENLAADPTGTGNVDGRLYFNTVTNIVRFYNGTIWVDIGTTSNAHTFQNVPSGDVTVVTGTTRWHPNLTIDTGDTYTVDAGGTLMSGGTLTVNGTLTNNGTVEVLG